MNPLYRSAQFMLGAAATKQFPEDDGYEVAFAGRSNSGKSSAINVITNRKSLARISKTPGRTQQINFFGLDDQRRLVDLPGYGYAKVPERAKRDWTALIDHYLQHRRCLQGLMIMVDSRHPDNDHDKMLLNWCHAAEMPYHVLLTKSDKLSRGQANSTLHEVARMLDKVYPVKNSGHSVQLFSSLKKTGVDEAHDKLDSWLAV